MEVGLRVRYRNAISLGTEVPVRILLYKYRKYNDSSTCHLQVYAMMQGKVR